jgi:hypothetical protein
MIKEANMHRQIIKIGIVCSVVFCALVFTIALYAHFYVPGSTLLSPEMLVWRMGSGIISYILATGLIFYTNLFFHNRPRPWISIPLLGLVIAVSSFFSYYFIEGYFSKINCAQEITFGECYLLNSSQQILAAVSALIISSVIGGALYFIVGYLNKTLLRQSTLK